MTEPIEFTCYLAGEDEDSKTSIAPIMLKKDYARIVFELPKSERMAAYKLDALMGLGLVLKVKVSVDE